MPETVEITGDLIESLTGGEIIAMEDFAGVPIDEFGSPGVKKGRVMVAMAWAVKHRQDPDYTFDEAMDLSISFDSKGEPDPSGPADDAGS